MLQFTDWIFHHALFFRLALSEGGDAMGDAVTPTACGGWTCPLDRCLAGVTYLTACIPRGKRDIVHVLGMVCYGDEPGVEPMSALECVREGRVRGG